MVELQQWYHLCTERILPAIEINAPFTVIYYTSNDYLIIFKLKRIQHSYVLQYKYSQADLLQYNRSVIPPPCVATV
jgi:hypothetical protein